MRNVEDRAIVRFLMNPAYMCPPQQNPTVPKPNYDSAVSFQMSPYNKIPTSI